MKSIEEIRKYKNELIQKLLEKDANYPAETIRCMLCEDTDMIPKVPNAGLVFEDYQLMYNGIKITKDAFGDTNLIRVLRGHQEPQQEKVFDEVLQYMPSQAVMIELGCNWAYYSLCFAKKVTGAKNYLIEPCLTGLELAKKNFALNEMIGLFTQGYIDGYLESSEEAMKQIQGAEKILIDEFLDKNQIEHVNILHSDIQGYEHAMLFSAKESILRGKIDYFFISTHSNPATDIHQLCRDFLTYYDYQIIAEHTFEEAYEPDGLIVAKRKNAAGPENIAISKASKSYSSHKDRDCK